MKKPLVSIVIVNWNGLDDTKLCLEHTKKQTYKNIEIIVVDNGSNDGSLSYLRKYPGIKLVENSKNLGFTGGHIAGYEASNGNYILLLNNDAIMDNDYVKNAIGTMQSDERIGALGGRAYLWDEHNELFDTTNEFYSYQNINLTTAEGIFAKSDKGVLQEVNNVSGSCVMVRRGTIDEIGYLHNPFFAYYEESDLFARMKRAGFKVIYSPKLAIWHANAKSSNKKAPTFFYYMIMRNRFRFAVRNFDSWSLRRFLKFYLTMGAVSALKSLLPLKQRPMHQAYAKAFFYNSVFGWRAFMEREQLRRELGNSDYNQIIFREQNGISIVVEANHPGDVDDYNKLSSQLKSNDEIVIVASESDVIDKIKNIKNLDYRIRFCQDKGVFETHSQNLGVICSRNDWAILVADKVEDEQLSAFSNNLYFIDRSSKKLAALAADSTKFGSLKSVISGNFAKCILVKRSLFIDNGGLNWKIGYDAALREMIAYSSVVKSFFPISVPSISSNIPEYGGDYQALYKNLSSRFQAVKLDNKQASTLNKLAAKYYRIAQLRTLVQWLLTFRMPLRLKAGRLKNISVALLNLRVEGVATELKHMSNEVSIYRHSQDLVSVKKEEESKLKKLIDRPSETPIFIILRDRYEPLTELLKWLDSQNLKKIIFIDNDSRLPPLMDYLKATEFQVLELARNMTQKAPWSAGIIKVLLPEDFYVVTDPDIIPDINEPETLKYFYELHEKYPHYLKVGFGLKIDDLPQQYALKDEVIKWESQFWKSELEPGVFEAGIDTTFALYKPHTYKYLLHPSLRTGEPYTARHLPWYSKKDELTDEEVFYRLRADQAVTSWNKDHLPERYKKELEKQRH